MCVCLLSAYPELEQSMTFSLPLRSRIRWPKTLSTRYAKASSGQFMGGRGGTGEID